MADDWTILAINPGSTSTKIAVYRGEILLWEEVVRHSAHQLARYARVVEQKEMRLGCVLALLDAHGLNLARLDAVVGRGGLLRPVPAGTYRVNEQMLYDVLHPVGREHASNLGVVLAHEIASRAREAGSNVSAWTVDPVSVDEMEPLARVSGLPEIERRSLLHALNLKAVGRRTARDLGTRYEQINLIGVHLGGGISVSAHQRGAMIDVNQALDGAGPFSPERAGGLPVGDVVRMCYGLLPSGDMTPGSGMTPGRDRPYDVGVPSGGDVSPGGTRPGYAEVMHRLVGGGGLVAHLGTNDALEVERRIEAGDAHACLIYEAMAYQIAHEIGGMAAVLKGEVDAIYLCGGLAHSQRLVGWIVERTAWIAPVRVYPGQFEMRALVQGALRVLSGIEPARDYPGSQD
jgi:butyrate kinase